MQLQKTASYSITALARNSTEVGLWKAKGLGSLEIDGELILGWGLCWSGAVTMIARNNRLINADAAPFLKFPR